MESREPRIFNDWILRVGDGENFKTSSDFNTWGLNSTSTDSKYFISNAIRGDRLWFVTTNSKGRVLAVATFASLNKREEDVVLVNDKLTDEELGWKHKENEEFVWKVDTEIHYIDLYNVWDCEILTNIKSPKGVRKYSEKCAVNLPEEYPYIVKYFNKVKRTFLK